MDAQPEPQKPVSHYEQIIPLDQKQVREESLNYMKQVTGWCSETKGTLLIDLVFKTKPDVIVEIGVWGGRSLIPMANVLKKLGKGTVYGIDPWDHNESLDDLFDEVNISWWAAIDHESILNELIRQIKEFNLTENIVLYKTNSEKADPIYDIDILHIDGNHSEKASYLDVTKWVPLVKKGGFIVMDDTQWIENGSHTTKKAVDWLNEHCNHIAEFSEQAGWGVWVKK